MNYVFFDGFDSYPSKRSLCMLIPSTVAMCKKHPAKNVGPDHRPSKTKGRCDAVVFLPRFAAVVTRGLRTMVDAQRF